MAKYFGTDGVRGIANKQLTAQLAYRLGRAGAYVLAKHSSAERPKIIIGRDTRISGPMLEGALIAGICSVGGDVIRVGVVPTPAVAYLARSKNATAGIMISASHNPAEDNGIKFLSSTGYKLSDLVEEEIETLALNAVDEMPYPIGADVGSVQDMDNAIEEYIGFLKKTVDMDLKGVKVIVDCANGAAYQAAPQTLMELGAEVIAINNMPDGININKDCGSTYPQELQKAVVEQGATLGIAHDGDADRVVAVDEKGRLVDGDQIITICGLHMKEKGLLPNDSLVVTVMSNIGLHLALEKAGIKAYQTKVGDRYVLEKMLETGCSLGGEQSGHIIFLEYNTTGDGLLTALQLLQVAADTGKPISELADQMQTFPQVLINAKVHNKEEVMSSAEFKEKIAEAEEKLNKKGRVLVRPSGTEPLIRVMVEGPDEAEIKKVAEELAKLAEKI